MDEGKLFGKGISFPPRIGSDGRVAWSAGAQNIRESIYIILLTETQERLMLPEFGGGLKQFLFEPNTPMTHSLLQEQITHALNLWEPRINVEFVSVEKDPTDDQSAIVTINYKLVATGMSDQINMVLRTTG